MILPVRVLHIAVVAAVLVVAYVAVLPLVPGVAAPMWRLATTPRLVGLLGWYWWLSIGVGAVPLVLLVRSIVALLRHGNLVLPRRDCHRQLAALAVVGMNWLPFAAVTAGLTALSTGIDQGGLVTMR